MATLNIFCDSDKKIIWTSFADCDATLIAEQKSSNSLDHLTIDVDQLIDIDHHYVNDAGDGVVAFSTFDPTYSATTGDVDDVINITGVPSGTEVFLDTVSAGTMSDTTLTLTAKQGGKFKVALKKSHYVTHTTIIKVKRRRE